MSQQIDAYSEFGYYIHRIVGIIDKRGDALFKQNLGISLRQFLLLRLIEADERHAPSQQLLAERLGIAKSAVSRHIDVAQRKGWITVETAEGSRKQHALRITRHGKHLLVQAQRILQESEAEGFGDMSKADVEATLRVMRRLYEKLELV